MKMAPRIPANPVNHIAGLRIRIPVARMIKPTKKIPFLRSLMILAHHAR
jgi:hypothetical protein